MQATPFTNKTFILSTDFGERLGIIIKDPKHDNLSLVTKESQDNFSSVKELEELFDDEIHFVEIENEVKEDIFIDGYPVKHKTVYNVEKGGEYITYTSTPNSKIRWVAGWWGIQFTGNYVGFFCPKLATVTENTKVGAFKNKAELLAAMNILGKRDKEDKIYAVS